MYFNELLESLKLENNLIYTDFEINDTALIIKKTNDTYSSFLVTKELFTIYYKIDSVKFDIQIQEDNNIYINLSQA